MPICQRHAEFLPLCCHHRHIDTNARINDQ
jgi:hypothetical protein